MSYRVLCDEHVDPGTVGELEAVGKTATHVRDAPGPSATDTSVIAFAREHDYVLLTNDDDFLGSVDAGVTILFFPDNRASPHELAGRVRELQTYYPTQRGLPAELFLTDRLR